MSEESTEVKSINQPSGGPAVQVNTGMDTGSMGIKNMILRDALNSSAMVAIVGILFWVLSETRTLHVDSVNEAKIQHSESMGMMKDMLRSQESNHRTEREALTKIVEKNSQAIDRLAEEVKLSRLERIKAKQDKE